MAKYIQQLIKVLGILASVYAIVVNAHLIVNADDGSAIYKTSIQVTTTTIHDFTDARGKRDDDTWSWAPRIKFNVGPIPSGSQFSVAFFLPGEKPWVTYECQTPAVEDGKIGNIEGGYGLTHDKLKTITDTGAFTFRIQLKNELAGTNSTVFSGRFNVKRFHVGPDLPKTRNNFEYYVDHDWDLPIGFLWSPRPARSADGVVYYDDYAPLHAALWFKGDQIWEKDIAAYLFYQGKEISNTKSHGHVVSEISNSTGQATSPYEYSRVRFDFVDVFAFAADPRAHPGFYLDKNPGDYEIKVLRLGRLARVLRFNVGADGKIVDNGIAHRNSILGPRMVVPVQVMGETDGPWNKEDWRTEALYGNPLKGFMIP